MLPFNQAVYVVPFLGMAVELNEIEASMLQTVGPYATATNRETSIVIGFVAVLFLIPMYCAFAAPAVAAFVLQTVMFFLSFAPLVYSVGRNKDQYSEGEALSHQAQAVLLGASAAAALLVAIGVHRTYMAKRIEGGKCACVVYPGYGTLSLLSASVIAFVGLAVDAQANTSDDTRVVKAGSISTAMIVSLVVGNLFELLLPIVTVLWGVGIACPMLLATAIVAFMKRSECPNIVAMATDVYNYQAPLIPLDQGEIECARSGFYVAGGCAAAGAVAITVQLLIYCCIVRPRAAKARAAEELAVALSGDNTTMIDLAVNETVEVPLLISA